MVNKKKKMPPAKTLQSKKNAVLDLQTCQDRLEEALNCLDQEKPARYKKQMMELVKDTELLLGYKNSSNPGKGDTASGDTSDSDNAGDDTSDNDSAEEITDFLTTICFDIGSFMLEEGEEEIRSTAAAELARPYLERALTLFKSQADVSKSYYKQTVIYLSDIYATLHLHQQDIALCEDYLDRLTKKYNQWTPLQIEVLFALAQASGQTGKLDAAEAIYKEIVSLSKINFGDQSEQAQEAEEDLRLFHEEKADLRCTCLSGIS